MFCQLERLEGRAQADARKFQEAAPYPHIVIEDFLEREAARAIIERYPDADWEGWENQDKEHQRYKRVCNDVLRMPAPLAGLITELSSGRFIRWLERLTGIPHLLPDPHLAGGGLHLTLRGGWLTPHTDFHTGRMPNLYRRLNLLVYLNEGWNGSDGGALEIWNAEEDRVAHRVLPELGRAVLFRTDDRSLHGFSEPVRRPERRSVALYYYTAEPTAGYSGDNTTYWRAHTVRPAGVVHAARLQIQRFFLFLARGFSRASWLMAEIGSWFRK